MKINTIKAINNPILKLFKIKESYKVKILLSCTQEEYEQISNKLIKSILPQ